MSKPQTSAERSRKRRARVRFDKFVRAAAKYLRGCGWYVVVGGPVTIEQRGFGKTAKFKYRLVMDFLGRPR